MQTIVFNPEVGYQPNQLQFPKYMLIGTLGKQEKEEAAARILNVSRQQGAWMGVSWTVLAEKMLEEMEQIIETQRIRNENFKKEVAYEQSLKKRRMFNMFTLGVYSLFSTKPIMPELETIPENDIQISSLMVFGPQPIINGIHLLIDEEYIEKKEMADGEYLFPTPKLFKAVEKFVLN